MMKKYKSDNKNHVEINIDNLAEERLQLGKRIRKIRLQLGYSQEKFAEILGITLNAYKRWENANRQISIDGLRILHKEFHVSVDYLLFGKKTEFNETWEAVQNCSEEDKMRLYMRLFAYFCNIKEETFLSNDQLNKIDSSTYLQEE